MQQWRFLINGQNLILITSGILHHMHVWSSAALETLPVCVFMFPVTARTRVEYTFSFTSASKNIFLENMIDCLT